MNRGISNERKQILSLLRWYRTPASGVVDDVSRNIARPEVDRLMFRLAELGAGVPIKAKVAGAASLSFFGVVRPRYHIWGERVDKKEKVD